MFPNRRYQLLAAASMCMVFALLAVVRWVSLRTNIGEIRALREPKSSVFSLAFDRRGESIAAAGEDGVWIWDLSTGRQVLHRDVWTWAVRFMPDNKRLAVADLQKGVGLVGIVDGSVDLMLADSDKWVALDVSPDGKWLATSASRYFSRASGNESWAIHVWELNNREESFTLTGHVGPVVSLALHPTAPLLLSASHDGTRRLWDLEQRRQINMQGDVIPPERQPSFVGKHVSLAFHPNGRTFLSGGSLFLVDGMKSEQVLWNLAVPYVTAGTFSPDGTIVATGHDDGTVRLWSSLTRKQLASFNAFRNHGAVYSVVFSPDGSRIATSGAGRIGGFSAMERKEPGDDTTVRIWRVSDLMIGK